MAGFDPADLSRLRFRLLLATCCLSSKKATAAFIVLVQEILL